MAKAGFRVQGSGFKFQGSFFLLGQAVEPSAKTHSQTIG